MLKIIIVFMAIASLCTLPIEVRSDQEGRGTTEVNKEEDPQKRNPESIEEVSPDMKAISLQDKIQRNDRHPVLPSGLKEDTNSTEKSVIENMR